MDWKRKTIRKASDLWALPQRDNMIEATERTDALLECAFAGCSGLTSVTIPSTLTNIHQQAFANCPNLKAINVVKDGKVEEVSFEEFAKQWKIEGPKRQIQDGRKGVSSPRGLGSLRERRALRDKQRKEAEKNK